MPDQLSRWLDDHGFAIVDALFASAPDMVCVIDRALVVRYLNWTGPSVAREAALNQPVLSLLPANKRDEVGAIYERVFDTGEPEQFELVFGDGEDVRIWACRVGPIRHEGEVVGLVGMTTNVARQRRATADRDRFFELSLDMLVVADAEGRFVRVNPAFAHTLGYDPNDLTGKPFTDFVHRDDVDAAAEAHAGVTVGTPILDYEIRFRSSDGSYRAISWRATFDPVAGHVYAVGRDVTAQRTLEAQLRHAQKLEAVGQLAGGVAHDFNNLMQAILANAELAMARRPAPSKVLVEHLRDIESAGRRAADLTRQLLAFSRRQPLQPAPVDLNLLAEGMMKMLRRLLPENVVIDVVADRALDSVNADPSQIEQVIANLCLNACDAMPHGGRLTITIENHPIDAGDDERHAWATPGRYVRMSVTDTGIGMTPEVRERIFEPFFTTKGKHDGTGLGLSTVYGIVRQHGGMILVQSEPGEGTTFEVYLAAQPRVAPAADEVVDALPPTGGETILLSEDEEAVRRVVAETLERAGYRVLVTSNGREAIALATTSDETIDLAMLDIVMPELGGPETWTELRRLRPDLRVLFCSGYADGRHRERLPDGAEPLAKPFRVNELLHRVRAVLDDAPEA